ncbi:MAG: precorrin-6y C5,15-methyltransferase (decarboxylating) subunit CbiE [Desulfobacca sp.]|nr:precorrin-6y C5,15-methyltransferase (decarboxylating) subunit CbiE [Desulfobacca sp.]
MIPVQVVGCGMSPADLTSQGREVIKQAQVLVGGRRLLGYFPDHPAEKIVMGKAPADTVLSLAELARDRQVVILASGDPNFFGIGPLVVRLLGEDNVVIHPNLTAVQTAAARLKMPWHEAQVISLHGRGWESLDDAIHEPGRWFIYTDPRHTPQAIARHLLDSIRIDVRLCVLEDLGQETERWAWLSLEEAVGRNFSPLNLVVLELIAPDHRIDQEPPLIKTQHLHLGMPEAAYAPERGLITKAEVRAVILARLELYPGQVLWDVGAGSGSVGLEASLLIGPGRILSIEKKPERAARIAVNREKFQVNNLEVVSGQAPGCLATLPSPDRVFIGGGGKALADILTESLARLQPQGKLVLTATRLETLEIARRVLLQGNFLLNIIQLQVSRTQPLAGGTYLQALNPVWIVAGSAQAR